jgi:hypothetical protein
MHHQHSRDKPKKYRDPADARGRFGMELLRTGSRKIVRKAGVNRLVPDNDAACQYSDKNAS